MFHELVILLIRISSCALCHVKTSLSGLHSAVTCEVGLELLGQNHMRYGATCRGLIFSASHYTFLKVLWSSEDLILVPMDTDYSPMIAQYHMEIFKYI